MNLTEFFGLKQFLLTIGGTLLMVGAQIEPSVGIWIVSVGGSLLTAALGKDRTVFQIIIHVFVGLFWGIFGSQVIHAVFPIIPQIAASFFASLFGVEATSYFIRSFRNGSMSNIIMEIVKGFFASVPWYKPSTTVTETKEKAK